MKLRFLLVVLVACGPKPAPSYFDGQGQGPSAQGPGEQGPGMQGPGAHGPGTQGPGTQGPGEQGPAANGPSADMPIDPTADMPATTLTTDAKLEVGKVANVTLDARSDIFSASMKKADEGRGGMLPSAVTLAAGGNVVSFTSVKGKVGCSGDAAFIADGGDCAGGHTDLLSTDHIAGVVASDRTLFLVGVFTGAKLPVKAPARLDFSGDKLGVAFASLEPKLGQVFFIGDGKTGTGSGVIQKFKVPAGATMLYLGYADGYGFMGAPGAYGDNKGGLSVQIQEDKE